jgi:hypothetical protein
MPIDPAFPYDVFISYAREDVEWARRMEADLVARGLEVFRDETRLLDGQRWDRSLLDAIEQSRHLVVLRSEATEHSQWTEREVTQFDSFRAVNKIPETVRPPIVALLEGDWDPQAPYQMILKVRDTPGAYEGGADALDDDVWRDVVERVERSIRAEDDRLAIPVLLVTTTRQRLEDVDAAAVRPERWSLEEFADRLTFAGLDDVYARYGNTRTEWRPFDSAASIGNILQDLQDRINADLDPQRGFRWRYVDEDRFWGSSTGARAEARLLSRGPALVIVDPLAFHDDLVD